ncbi:MAG TPA: BatA and WFA domain-containing protein [Candidatus Binatia bacterium]|nr:BatA and WFA domain-containing protein [Candidatus Binatia bacterium]
MSVVFLYPIFLFGLLAASLPILIHLLNRRKLERLRFPAVRFILLSQKRISRSYRLRHWLLLALRTLAVALLALLLANPIFQTGAGLFAGGGPVALVVLLDNSLSMKWSGEGDGFKQAKEAARLLLSALNEGDRAALIPTNFESRETFRLKGQKEVLLKELDGIEIADGTADFSAALAKAYELLSEPAGQKEIRLITDLALTGWDQFSLAGLKLFDPSISLKVIRIGGKPPALNAAVKEVRLAGQGVGANLPLQIEATIANFGEGEIKEMLAQLSIDGQNREQKLATVPPRGEATVTFHTRLSQPGSHTGRITLKKDGLAGNPDAYFALHAQDHLKILVVDGDPQTSLVQSESFFLSRALNPAGEREASLFLPTVILSDSLNAATLESYQVLILCNVAALADAAAAKIQNYLRQGGGLLIFGGDKFQPEIYSQKLPQIFPAQLREKKLGAEANGEKIEKLDLNHPALQMLSDRTLMESIKSARVWGYTRGAPAPGNVLIGLANGDPLLLEQKAGAGKVLLFTSSADRDWNDLPVKTVYLPLLQSLAQYLAGGQRGALDPGIPVGAVKELTLPPAYVGKTLRVTAPDQQTAEIPIAGEKDRAIAKIDSHRKAGFYRLALPSGGEKDNGLTPIYAVNTPFLESRLEPIGAGELQAKLSPIRAEVISAEALKEGGTRTDLALPLLGFLIVTLLLEGWLAQRF